MKEYRRDELQKHAEMLHPDMISEMHAINEELRAMKMKLPKMQRQVLAYQNKLQWIG